MNEKDVSARNWHDKFKKYTEFITNHKNYRGLFFEKDEKGIKWVVAGKSPKGLLRRKWWDEECRKNKIKIEPGCYAKIALMVHPTKKHTCQICGKELSIEYVYPNKRLLLRIKRIFGLEIEKYKKDVFEIVDELYGLENDIEKIKIIFDIEEKPLSSLSEIKKYIKEEYVENQSKSYLSPGVMSNSPDRFDGYHSDGNCCRSESDKGRHSVNLKRYTQDRRVYENWTDGNWKKADRLMGEFRKHGVSPDHIGPISLGFCHRAKFNPLTHKENSSKNNRMTLEDVKTLIEDEKKEIVVSWHSKYLWDKLKYSVKTNADAKKLSTLMRLNLHQILIVFSIIDDAGHAGFLKTFLNPQYSFYDYKFNDFDPVSGSYSSVLEIKRTGKNQKNNINRYYRVAFDELKKYKVIDNRKTKVWNNTKVDKEIKKVIELLNINNEVEAKKALEKVFMIMIEDIDLN